MTDEQFYTFDSVGVLILRQGISAGVVFKMNERIDSALQGRVVAKFPFMELDRIFFSTMAHPAILNCSARILGEQFRFDHAFGLQQPAGGANLHGGPETGQSSCFYHAGTSTMGQVGVGRLSVGIALNEQSRLTGGFAYIPGSHKSSFRLHGGVVLQRFLHGNFDHESIAVPELRAGDIYVFPDCLVHGTSPRKVSGTRRAIYYMYCPGYMAWRPYSEIEKYVPLAENDTERRLLRPPFVASYEEDDERVGDNRFRETTRASAD
jgi:hypothetical protein